MITHRQRDCLKLIAEAKICPSYTELADAMGIISKSGISRIVCALEERGMINRLPNHARAMEVTAKGIAVLSGSNPQVVFKPDVDFLMNRIKSDLFYLLSAVANNDPREQIFQRIEAIDNFIKTKWTEK